MRRLHRLCGNRCLSHRSRTVLHHLAHHRDGSIILIDRVAEIQRILNRSDNIAEFTGFLNTADHGCTHIVVRRKRAEKTFPIHHCVTIVAAVEVIGAAHHQSFPVGRINLEGFLYEFPRFAAEILTLNHRNRVSQVNHDGRIARSQLIGLSKGSFGFLVILHGQHGASEHHPALNVTRSFSEMITQLLQCGIHVVHFASLADNRTGVVIHHAFIDTAV